MSEQQLLKDCKTAFPDLEKGSYGLIEQASSLADTLTGRQGDPQMRQDLVKHFGFPDSGSILIDNARVGKACSDVLTREKNQQLINNVVKGAEVILAKSILEGKHEVAVHAVGDGKPHLSNTVYTAPELNATSREILDRINKNPALKAEVKQTDTSRSEFFIVVKPRN